MKRTISILFVSLSILMLLMHTVVPHHHHDGYVCFAIIECDEHNHENDEHTKHQGLPDDCEHTLSCFANSEYIDPQNAGDIKRKVSSFQNHDIKHLFPILFLASDFLVYDTVITLSDFKYADSLLFYKYAGTNRFHGLRAPPLLIS